MCACCLVAGDGGRCSGRGRRRGRALRRGALLHGSMLPCWSCGRLTSSSKREERERTGRGDERDDGPDLDDGLAQLAFESSRCAHERRQLVVGCDGQKHEQAHPRGRRKGREHALPSRRRGTETSTQKAGRGMQSTSIVSSLATPAGNDSAPKGVAGRVSWRGGGASRLEAVARVDAVELVRLVRVHLRERAGLDVVPLRGEGARVRSQLAVTRLGSGRASDAVVRLPLDRVGKETHRLRVAATVPRHVSAASETSQVCRRRREGSVPDARRPAATSPRLSLSAPRHRRAALQCARPPRHRSSTGGEGEAGSGGQRGRVTRTRAGLTPASAEAGCAHEQGQGQREAHSERARPSRATSEIAAISSLALEKSSTESREARTHRSRRQPRWGWQRARTTSGTGCCENERRGETRSGSGCEGGRERGGDRARVSAARSAGRSRGRREGAHVFLRPAGCAVEAKRRPETT